MCSLQTGIHFRTTRKEAKVVPSMTLASWCSLPADSRQGRRCSCCLALQRSCKRRERPGKPHSSELCWLRLLPRPLFLPLSPCSTCRTRLTNAPFVPFSHGRNASRRDQIRSQQGLDGDSFLRRARICRGQRLLQRTRIVSIAWVAHCTVAAPKISTTIRDPCSAPGQSSVGAVRHTETHSATCSRCCRCAS